MSMEYIRDTYKVPARRGTRVCYTDGESTNGTITGSSGAYLRIRLDGEKHSGLYHPTWGMQYLPPATTPKDRHEQ